MATLLKSRERGMKHLKLEDFPHIKESDLFKIKRCLPPCSVGGPWIAGGSVWRTVRNEPLNECDVDVFFKNKDQYEQTCRQMNSIPFVRNILKETKNKWNTTYRIHVNQGRYDKTIDIQLINMSFYSRLERLLESFDFTVCQFGYDGESIIECGIFRYYYFYPVHNFSPSVSPVYYSKFWFIISKPFYLLYLG